MLSVRALPVIPEKHIENGDTKSKSARALPVVPDKHTELKVSNAKHDSKLDVKLDVKHDLKLDVKLDVKHDSKLDVKLDAKLDAKHDSKLDAKVKQKTEESAPTNEVEDRFERRKGRELDTDYIKKLKAEKEKLEKTSHDKPILVAPMTEKERIEKNWGKKKDAWEQKERIRSRERRKKENR